MCFVPLTCTCIPSSDYGMCPTSLLRKAVERLQRNKSINADFKLSRCFEINYVIVLLRRLNPKQEKIEFADTVDGANVDWPLGSYIASQSPLTIDSITLGDVPSNLQVTLWYWMVGMWLVVPGLLMYHLSKKHWKLMFHRHAM